MTTASRPAGAVFESERLFARPWRLEEDAPGAFRMYGDPEVVRHIGGVLVANLEEQRTHIAMIQQRIAGLPVGQGSWPMFEKITGELVGTALLKPLPKTGAGRELSGDIEVGWHLARAHWGRGLASEMGRALLAYGFATLGLDVLHAVVESPNVRSRAVARRIGMRHVGKTDAYYDATLEHFMLKRESWVAR